MKNKKNTQGDLWIERQEQKIKKYRRLQMDQFYAVRCHQVAFTECCQKLLQHT